MEQSTDNLDQAKSTDTQANQSTDNAGNDTSKTAQPFKTYATQADFDNESAKIRGNAERVAEKKLLAELGLTPESKDKLAAIKAVYESSLTDGEKAANEIRLLQETNARLMSELQERDYTVLALAKVNNPTEAKILVKMARGLVDENTTMEQALDQVCLIMNKQANDIPPTGGLELPSDSANKQQGQNPFKKETINLTEQGRLIKTDKELARRLYQQANGKMPSW